MNIDPISWQILNAVQNDGRISLKALAAEIGLSLPATSERLKRLEEAGIISGYRAVVKPESVGYGVMAIMAMTTLQPDKARLIKLLTDMPEVIECLHVTGQDSYVIRVVTRDLQHLEDFAGSINQYGETRTSIVLSHPIRLRPVSSLANHD
ncbi:Lrp/AsnC family transcriptional regulator [Aliamphritea ceti]|uniref:Lrp/AsnC family transcriptional regulator n=1 Tax=Aliamphritea ceti TaxID=1524258 RepID=UPI0021C3C98F|nr:Lrp/AsnC family transcriptional regulator [Aliamphritea ceti]